MKEHIYIIHEVAIDFLMVFILFIIYIFDVIWGN